MNNIEDELRAAGRAVTSQVTHLPELRLSPERAGSRSRPVRPPHGGRRWLTWAAPVAAMAMVVAVAATPVAVRALGGTATAQRSGETTAPVATGSGQPVSKVPTHRIAANFTLPFLGDSHRQLSLAQYKGKPVVVSFFASWCKPCQQETPLLESWYKHQDGKVVLLGLDENDTTANAQKFVAVKGVSYPIGFDPNTVAARAYDVAALPQTFFLNAQHRIVDHIDGVVTKSELARGLSLMNSAS